MLHYHVYEQPSAMTTGFQVREQADAHAARFRGARVVECEAVTPCDRMMRDEDGNPVPRGPLTGKPWREVPTL